MTRRTPTCDPSTGLELDPAAGRKRVDHFALLDLAETAEGEVSEWAVDRELRVAKYAHVVAA